jgi:hypothetical protein
MSLELGGMIAAGIVALITFILAYGDEQTTRRRILRIVSLVFGFLGGLFALEAYVRNTTIEDSKAAIERRWIVLQDANIEGVEFEILLPDGTTDLSELLRLARQFSVSFVGVKLPLPVKPAGPNSVDLSAVFSLENLKQSGRLGIAQATVHVANDKKGAKQFDAITCISSTYTKSTVLSQAVEGRQAGLVCAAAVMLPISKPIEKLRIFQSEKSRITIAFTEPRDGAKGLRCVGVCTESPLLSIRVILKEAGALLPTMLEISPLLYNVRPTVVSGSKPGSTVELRGPDALKLAESRFKQSFGFLDFDRFAFTKGAFNWVYRYFTEGTETMRFIDVVWTTDPSPPRDVLMNAIAPEDRAMAEAFRADEWCGFGERPLCWSRFAVFVRQSQ